ncbi:DUF3040 domain-containing protein [Saccharothrix syringae]|uniref:DUF3040 domain-containing protein n=1 Tax=Saccharothrix syringae TaxID=103733 RepID=A0A5Q0GXV9_SACSY|nr:DUF3040 domain-containing protein [Saccharothrix syringae]
MGLRDHEERELARIERQLAHDDPASSPDSAARARGSASRARCCSPWPCSPPTCWACWRSSPG